MLNIAVCDDSPAYIAFLKEKIQEYCKKHDLECKIWEFYSGEDLLETPVKQYHLVFLDVRMQQLNGIQIAVKIREKSEKTLILFVSSYIQYAPLGYQLNAIRYLLKSQLEATFDECMATVMDKLSPASSALSIRCNGHEILLSYNRICWAESCRRKVIFYMDYTDSMNPTSQSCYAKLSDIAARLDGKGFLQCHKSYLVNIHKVKEIKRYHFLMENEMVVPISRDNYPAIYRQYFFMKEQIGNL